jgi:hypothetical protein
MKVIKNTVRKIAAYLADGGFIRIAIKPNESAPRRVLKKIV